MPIVRCKDQSRQDLREFYTELEDWSAMKGQGNSMLVLLDKLDDFLPNTTVYGLTSLANLLLLEEDFWQSQAHVSITSLGAGKFRIRRPKKGEISVPDRPEDVIASSEDEAAREVLTVMLASPGWPGNEEIAAAVESSSQSSRFNSEA